MGMVTFLFTDIEGSTQLWEERPADMQGALAGHDEILRHTVESHNGYVFATTGEGFAVAFTRARDAIDTAVEVQRALSTPVGPRRCSCWCGWACTAAWHPSVTTATPGRS